MFDSVTEMRGEAYVRQGKVLESKLEKTSKGFFASGRVRGSRIYQVSIEIQTQPELVIAAICTCPMALDCKHTFALLKKLADDALPPPNETQKPTASANPAPKASPTAPTLNYALEAWVKSLEATFHMEEKYVEPWFVIKESPYVAVDIFYTDTGAVKTPKKLKEYGAEPNFLPETLQLVRLVRSMKSSGYGTLDRRLGGQVMEALTQSNRCYYRKFKASTPPLKLGAPRKGLLGWESQWDGRQVPRISVEASALILQTTPVYFVDAVAGEVGLVEFDVPYATVEHWLKAPPVEPRETIKLRQVLEQRVPVVLPRPTAMQVTEHRDLDPLKTLRVFGEWNVLLEQTEGIAAVEFDYLGTKVELHSGAGIIRHGNEQEQVHIYRDGLKEQKASWELAHHGFVPRFGLSAKKNEFQMSSPAEWFEFTNAGVTELREAGWEVVIDDSFPFKLAEVEEWYGEAETKGDWFSLELGVQVDGEKINLLPVMMDHLRNSAGDLLDPAMLESSEIKEIMVLLPNGKYIAFPKERIRGVLGILLELFNPKSIGKNGKLKLPKYRVADLGDNELWRWKSSADLRAFAESMQARERMPEYALPAGLRADLRDYQKEGFRWLNFLRENGLSGILADDMGLGKTVQALAVIQGEKELGRLDKPSLVVAPTSLMNNWRQEAERFTPELKVLVLHGAERHQNFEKIKEHDLIITSYPLLARDEGTLVKQEFHYVILDEAQYIKNSATIAAQIASSLKGRHRLCMSGTPIENHLGEMWSQFNFLMPNFLGDEQAFRRQFRNPIEKGLSKDRRQILARRVAPFILRRKKEDVVKELPPKTEMMQELQIEGGQRDLYETIRLAMHQRVREEVSKKGMNRSHIVILDALLKLRQVCCDPRLVKLEAAKKVSGSCKMEWLGENLPQMLEEGRRILLFSQFTSMLALIEEYLFAKNIAFVKLTGDTTDRATPVNEFQSGKVPLFLLSLKAGGTGLNLTAADTVILYDPWWNPAVEAQAMDRAHRIGQEKNVFVYKLITKGTVEEKILAMQDKKRELVKGLLEDDAQQTTGLSADDLESLFAPLR